MYAAQQLHDLVAGVRAGVVIEEPKLDLKREWPDLGAGDKQQRLQSQMEFLKDLVAMANTPGLVGRIIFGVDGDGGLHDARFESSGLRDITDLRGLVVRQVDPPVSFELNTLEVEFDGRSYALTVLEVPPSLEKPHVIRHYLTKSGHTVDNFIPIRKNTGTYAANKYDIEYMILDRKNVEPEYALDILSHEPRLVFRQNPDYLSLRVPLVLQNYGRKPIGLVASSLLFGGLSETQWDPELSMRLYSYVLEDGEERHGGIIVVPSNSLVPITAEYRSTARYYQQLAAGSFLANLPVLEKIRFTVLCESLAGETFVSREMAGYREENP